MHTAFRKEIWVVCEVQGGFVLNSSLELIAKAKSLRGGETCAVLLGHGLCDVPRQLFAAGADVVYVYDHPKLMDSNDYAVSRAVAGLAEKKRPAVILMSATIHGRSVAPQVAALLKTGLTADCTGLEMDQNGLLVQTRPAFGGNLCAEIICEKTITQMATVRAKTMTMPEMDFSRQGKIVSVPLEGMDSTPLRILQRIPESKIAFLGESKIIVSGGLGIRSRKGFEKLRDFAQLIHASVGASRGAVNAGYADYNMQIGQTGITVRPKLYIAFGISGAVQHLAGMKASGYVIAVNTDRKAPIFDQADIGMICDYEEAIHCMIKEWALLLKSASFQNSTE